MTRELSRILHAGIPGIADTVRVEGGTTIYVSGTVGVGRDGEPPADFAEQCELAIRSLQGSLRRQEATLADIVRLTLYVVGLDDERMDTWHEVRDRFFSHEHSPASSLIGVARLYSPAAWVEIEATAVI